MAFETTKKVNFQLGVSGADKLRSAMTSAGNAMRGLNREVGSVAQAFLGLAGIGSAGAFISMVNGTIDAKARLYDLGLQTGISVEALGGLRRVADYSGTSLDDVAGASNKLSKALATNNEDSKGAAQALKALGINFDQFKALGADQQLLAVAKAMEGFGDGTGKTAAAMLLFGKTGATLLPFLKEFAERGIMATRETTASALSAKEFADNLVTLREAGEEWKRTVVGDMLPTLTALTKQMAEAKTKSEGLGVAFRYLRDNNHFSDIDLQRKALERLNLQISVTNGLFDNMLAAQASEPYNRAYAQRVTELRTQLDLQRKAAADASEALKAHANLLTGAGAAGGGRGFVNPPGVTLPQVDIRTPSTGAAVRDYSEAILGKIREKIALDQEELELGRELTEVEKFQAQVYAEVDKNFGKLTISKMLGIDAELQLAVAIAKGRDAQRGELKWLAESRTETERTIEARAQFTRSYEDEVNALQRSHDEYNLSADAIERNAIARLHDSAALLLQKRGVEDFNPAQVEANRLLEYQANLLGEAADLRTGIAKKKAQDRDDPITGANNAVASYLKEVSEAGLATERVVGSALKDLEDRTTALFTHGKFGAREFIDTLISEFVRLRIVKPLLADIFGGGGGFFSALFGGGGFGTGALFGNLDIGGFLASGGPALAGTPYIVGERGPELFVPRSAGTVLPNGSPGGGSRVQVHQTIVNNIDSRSDRAQVAQLVGQAVAQGNRQLVEELRAQGAI